MTTLADVTQSKEANDGAGTVKLDYKFEVVVIPVADVDRAKNFYARLGWRFDIDSGASKVYRIVQFTPPGAGCSIIFGKNVTTAEPGSVQGLYLIVSDIEKACRDLVRRGVEVSGPFHGNPGVYEGDDEVFLFGKRRVGGPDPNRGSYKSFASFRDPDGNGWLLQEVTTRLPGHMDPTVTNFASVEDLAGALQRAEAAHGQFEKRTGQADSDWPHWYAEYIVREQRGEKLPE